MCVCVCAYARMCVHACVRACERACVRACVCVCSHKGNKSVSDKSALAVSPIPIPGVFLFCLITIARVSKLIVNK